MSSGFRVRILCEDLRTDAFLRALCNRRGVEVLGTVVAPNAARGGGSAFVLKNYFEQMKRLRSKSYQQRLGLLVHIDGDNLGVNKRKQYLDAKLVSPRQSSERVAIFVPTWEIETWILHLTGAAAPSETDQLKNNHSSPYRAHLKEIDSRSGEIVRRAVAAWPTVTATAILPSLQDALVEGTRIGI